MTEQFVSVQDEDMTCTKDDVENTFTNLYCYSNLLQSISDDNDTDHYRFVKFIQQVCYAAFYVFDKFI